MSASRAPRPARGPAAGRRWLGLLAADSSGRVVALATMVATASCAPIPPPDVLAELDQIRSAPAVVEARELVPSSVSRAELLRVEANEALEQGDFAGAQLIGERARAAFELAVAVARVARAQQDEAAALADADSKAEELSAADAEQQQVAAEISALQAELALLGGPPATPGAGDGSDGADRGAAVRALRLQARLICTAARLLEQKTPAAGAASSATHPTAGNDASSPSDPPALRALEARLGSSDESMPLGDALEIRQACLRHITLLRRALAAAPAALPRADELLVALSELDVGEVRRDDRGLAVTMRGLFEGDRLAPAATTKLASLGALARRHPSYPLLVVLHESGGPRGKPGPTAPIAASRAEAIVRALGVEATVDLAGDAQPVLPPDGRHARRNERVEVVFVSPSLL